MMTGPAFLLVFSLVLENFAYHVDGSPAQLPFVFAGFVFQPPKKRNRTVETLF